jgi:hypothetical protein
VVVLLSSSRSGSTVTHAALCGLGGLWATPGETAPYDTLVFPSFPEVDSDELGAPAAGDVERWYRQFARFLSLEARAVSAGEPSVPGTDAPGLALRLVWQWSGLVDFACALDLVKRAASDARRRPAADWGIREVAGLLEARRVGAPAELLPFYDGSAHLGRSAPGRLPFRALVEEPPFIVLSGRYSEQRPEPAVAPRVLVLKGPAWAHRLEVLHAMFGRRLMLVHLTRNPAAAVNGLIDGWLSPSGFFSRRMDEEPLAIRGYSDHFHWGREWWKFDLPAGWRDLRSAALVDVCAFQWAAAHAAIRSFHGRHPAVPYLRLRFESLVGGDAERRTFAEQVRGFVGLEVPEERLRAGLQRHVMTTAPPRRFRWLARAEELSRVLTADHVLRESREMGYADDRHDWL